MKILTKEPLNKFVFSFKKYSFLFILSFILHIGNTSASNYTENINAQISPTAECRDDLVISIGGGDTFHDIQGIARIDATTLNTGTIDAGTTLEIRRNHWLNGNCDENEELLSPWGGFTDFYCCDVGADITLELRVTDGEGNVSTCSTNIIEVKDVLLPYCYPPTTVMTSRFELPSDFPNDIEEAYHSDFEGTSVMMNMLFQEAWGTDNCAIDKIVEVQPQININSCGWGTIIRRFEVWQWRVEGDLNRNGVLDREEAWVSLNPCNQEIRLREEHNYTIDFPQDAIAQCGDECPWDVITAMPGTDILVVNTSTPIRFAATGNECYKLSITYDVINWCTWDGEYTGFNIPRQTEDDGELPINRIVNSSERPIISGDNNMVTLDRSNDIRTICVDGTGGLNPGDDSSLLNSTSAQNPNIDQGRWNYTQFIKVYDNTPPVLTVPEFGGNTDACPDLGSGQFCALLNNDAIVNIPFSAHDDCSILGTNILSSTTSIVSAQLDLFAVDLDGDGIISENEFTAEMGAEGNVTGNISENEDGSYQFTGIYPIISTGESIHHAINIVLEDACGNQTSKIIQFDVILQESPNSTEDLLNLTSAYVLYQNQPNPFNNETTISFHTPAASEITIDFRDVRGRLLYTTTNHYLPGLNKIKITQSVLKGVSGIVSYTLTSGTFIATKKMIVMD